MDICSATRLNLTYEVVTFVLSYYEVPMGTLSYSKFGEMFVYPRRTKQS